MSEEKENLKRLRTCFRTAFGERMKRYGFDRHGGGMYYEKTDYGRRGVMLLDYLRFGSLQVGANMTVTLTDVEALLFEYRTKVEGDTNLKRPEIQTLSENLGNIRGGIFRQWSNYNDTDIEETLDAVQKLIDDYGLAFLATIDSPEKALERILETTRRKTVLGHPTFWWEKAFALMFVLDRRDLFDEYLPIFDRLVVNKSTITTEYIKYKGWIEEEWSDRRTTE